MIRFTFSVLALLVSSSMAHADVQVFKIYDGAVAYCDTARETQNQTQKVVSLSLIDERSTDDNQDTTLRVSMVKCQNGQWVDDSNPDTEKYKTVEGVEVEVTYSNYELLLVNKNYDVLLQTSLDHLNQGSFEDQSVSFVKTRQSPQDLEVLIRARKTVKTNNGIEYSESVTFGGFRVRLK